MLAALAPFPNFSLLASPALRFPGVAEASAGVAARGSRSSSIMLRRRMGGLRAVSSSASTLHSTFNSPIYRAGALATASRMHARADFA